MMHTSSPLYWLPSMSVVPERKAPKEVSPATALGIKLRLSGFRVCAGVVMMPWREPR